MTVKVLAISEQPFFIMSSREATKTHCVYSHEIFDGTNPPVLIWIGVMRLTDLFSFSDAKRNNEWIKFAIPERLIMTRILAFGDYIECSNYRAVQTRERQPHCNVRGYDVGSNFRIRCIEDAREFDSITEACREYGLSASAVSNHINQKPGHKTVKGRTFERVART